MYKGRLHTGEVVAVKVQRPDALQIVAQDLVILKRGVDYYKSTIFSLARDLGPAGEQRQRDRKAEVPRPERHQRGHPWAYMAS